MATATIEYEMAVVPVTTRWWRRQDTYALAVVAVVHAAAVGPALWELTKGRWSVGGAGCVDEALIGVVCGQCFLLSIWAALGRFGTLVRWSIVGGVFLLGVGSLRYWFRAELDVNSQCLESGLMGALLVTTFAAALLPLRGMAGWRVDFDCAHYVHVRGRRGQFSFLDFAALSCAVAVPLAIMRLADETSDETAGWQWLTILGAMAAVGATAAPTCYCVLAWRRLPLAFAVGGGWALAVGLTHGLLNSWITGLDILGSAGTLTEAWLGGMTLHGAIAAVCSGTLAGLRLGGLRLFTVPLPQIASHAPRAEVLPKVTLRKAA